MKNKTLPALLVAFACTSPVFGQLVRDAAERADDHHQLRQDRQERRDDARDLARFQSFLVRFDEARSRNDRQALRMLDGEITRALGFEVAEGRVEMSRDAAEVRKSSRELRSSRREVRRDRRQERPDEVTRDDRRDLRDDRRDRRDDVRDARAEAGMQQQRQRIAEEFRGLRGRLDEGSLDRKRELLVDMVELARAEGVENRRETREDRRELREDRRETREDRRQGGR